MVDLLQSSGVQIQPIMKFQIFGTDSQIVQFSFSESSQTLYAIYGSLVYMSSNIQSWRSESKTCFDTWNRTMLFQNPSGETGFVSIAPLNPQEKILAIQVGSIPQQQLLIRRGSFLASVGKSMMRQYYPSRCGCCGGCSSKHELVTGMGTVFLSAPGCLLEKWLKIGEQIKVQESAILAMDKDIHIEKCKSSNRFWGKGKWVTLTAVRNNQCVYLRTQLRKPKSFSMKTIVLTFLYLMALFILVVFLHSELLEHLPKDLS